MMALKAGSSVALFTDTIIYISIQFKFVKKSLEEFSNIENSDNQMEQNTSSFLDEQHTCEQFNDRNLQVSATSSKSSQMPSQTQIPECCNKPKHTNTSTQTQAHQHKHINTSTQTQAHQHKHTNTSTPTQAHKHKHTIPRTKQK
jgi:hypothetical protein